MSNAWRAGFLIAFCTILGANAAPAVAADLTGTWTLNFPTDPTTWTFSQDGSSFNATATTDPGDPDYDIAGVAFGPWYAGILYFTIPGTRAPTVPIGALAGWVTGDTMNGFLASYLLGIVVIDGQRESQPAVQGKSPGSRIRS